MEEHNNVKNLLEELIRLNEPGSNLQVKNTNGGSINGTVSDLQELNYEKLASIADLIGMSELYLEK